MSEAEGVRWMPAVVCHDVQQMHSGSGAYFLEVKIIARPVGDPPPPRWRYPTPAGLGRKIAGLVVAECGLPPRGTEPPGEPG